MEENDRIGGGRGDSGGQEAAGGKIGEELGSTGSLWTGIGWMRRRGLHGD